MTAYLTTPFVFLLQTIFGLYVAIIAIRFLLQLVQANFYNPISQFINTVTTPSLRWLQRIVPKYKNLDLAALLLAWLLTTLELGILALVLGIPRSPFAALGWAIPSLVELFINILLFAVVIRVLLSWLSPDPEHSNAAINLVVALTEPLLNLVQRRLPYFSGMDVSPMMVIIGLTLLNMLSLPPLKWIVNSPF